MYFKSQIIKTYFFLLIFIFSFWKTQAQSDFNIEAFTNMSNHERYDYIQNHEFWKLTDNSKLASIHQKILEIVKQKKDIRSTLAIQFYIVNSYGQPNYNLPSGETLDKLYKQAINLAKEHGYEVEQLLFQYNLADINNGKNTKEYYFNQYPILIHTFDQIKQVGFKEFKDYPIDFYLYRFSKFMWDLEDYEKAFNFLTLAEKHITPTQEGAFVYTLVNNHLQSYWQKKGNTIKALEYAKKIYKFHNSVTFTNHSYLKWWSQFWKGFINIEIASLLIEQGKFSEGEYYANNGYQISKTAGNLNDSSVYIAEFDALQVLIPIKLKLSKFKEAKVLLERSKSLKKQLVDLSQFDYFKNINFYENAAEILKSEALYKDALYYQEQAQLIKDSLALRNHSKKLIVVQQRIDAEKHKQSIDELKTQKAHEVFIRNISIVILILAIIIAILNARYFRLKRKQKEFRLQVAKDRLQNLTKSYKEKSNLIDTLKKEKEQLEEKEQQNNYTDQLINSTILTEDDWIKFRGLFEKVHPNFIQQIEVDYLKPTKAEIRLLVLEKLELSVSQIANMLGVNNNTIYQTRRRLRKKRQEL